MAWWSPKSWFQKAPEPVPAAPTPDPAVVVTRWLANDEEIAPTYDIPEPIPSVNGDFPLPEIEPSIPAVPEPTAALVAPEGPFCWIPLDPEFPHTGLSSFIASPTPPPGHVLCVTGITPEAAAMELMGKVIAWERMTPSQENDLSNPPFGLRIDAAALRLLFR